VIDWSRQWHIWREPLAWMLVCLLLLTFAAWQVFWIVRDVFRKEARGFEVKLNTGEEPVVKDEETE